MIVVFVIDTSPSMGELVKKNLCRLDLAKMTVESLTGMLERRVQEHNHRVQMETLRFQSSLVGGTSTTKNPASKSLQNLRFGLCHPDQFLLLSTGRQHSSQPASFCGAGGRFLVGFCHGDTTGCKFNSNDCQHQQSLHTNMRQNDSFQRELKRLKSTVWKQREGKPRVPFPEDGGGSVGLNVALSTGLQLLSRYRLKHRCTENFGMGRLASTAILLPNSASGGSNSNSGVGPWHQATNALQPACLILLTDGDCLRKNPSEGGGPLQLQFGPLPLREFYSEPFRWDQRIFCLGIGSSSYKLHSSLRAFSEVTGGCHLRVGAASDIPQVSETLLRLIAPPAPSHFPIPNPLRLPSLPSATVSHSESNDCMTGGTYVNGGPICSFQQLDGTTTHRAMLLYTPFHMDMIKPNTNNYTHNAPIWCIPESFFSSKKLDSLPPRKAQPILHYTNDKILGAITFDPLLLMKSLHRLDHLVSSNWQILNSHLTNSKETSLKILQRDVYICEWLCQHGKRNQSPPSQFGHEHFSVCVKGAGRSSLTDGDESFLNIGVLNIPAGPPNSTKISTLTILPPDPHILLPLLVKGAEAENRTLKKVMEKKDVTNALLLSASKSVHLDENWRSELRAYLFRIPPYYTHSLRRSLRPILPSTAHSLLNTDSIDSVVSQCFSRLCLQKIRSAEIFSKESNERLERHEEEYLKHTSEHDHEDGMVIGYGKFDNRSDVSSYLASLRNMPPPWRIGSRERDKLQGSLVGGAATASDGLGNLPHQCSLAFYECRRRWIFGGSGLTTRGLAAEGVNNDGTNSHHYDANHGLMDESLLSIAGVGASALNNTSVSKMGDFKERLLFSRQPIVGWGSNDSTGSAATTAPDGSPVWSCDDDALPMAFFNPITGEFSDSLQTRVRARLSINFGNPYKDTRGTTVIPKKFMIQCPPLHQHINAPPGSPPHDEFSSDVEGEGEAVFGGRRPNSPPRHEYGEPEHDDQRKRKIEHSSQSLSKIKKEKTISSTVPGIRGRYISISQHPSGESMQLPFQHSGLACQSKPLTPPQRRLTKGKAISNKANENWKQKCLPPPPSRPPPPPLSVKLPIIPPKLSSKQRPPPPPPHTQKTSSSKRPPPPPRQFKPAQTLLKKKPPPPPKSAQGSKSRTQQSSLPSDAQSPNVKPKVKLPVGWISVWSKSQRRWYFFDQNTNKSLWEWPPPDSR